MARPEEKANAMLNKWVKMRDSENAPQISKRRPYLASHCEHLHDAEKWRRQIIREISNGIAKIQNPGLGEHTIRDLNDEINKLMREKYHWNKRIVELGGPDYNKVERHNQLAEQGKSGKDALADSSLGLQGSSGYKYYGAAKDLPGVKELFARNAVKVTKKKRGDVYKYITPDYYGLRDEEDGILLEIEEKAAKKRRLKLDALRKDYKENKERGADGPNNLLQYETDEEIDVSIGDDDDVITHEVVQKIILDKKKQDLLDSLL